MTEPALLCSGRYELGPVIGRGGMAEVRSGRDIRLDRPVAVKFLRPEVAHQPGARDRFETEARLAARLSHPHVVAVFDTGETEGVPFIVMERLPGPTLHDRLRSGPLPVAEVKIMATQILGALQAAHDAGVLHRDIKPGNVMAATGGGWKVGDFGIAKALEVDQQDLTATGLLIGTPAYLAPERFFGTPATVASDLYAVAVVLYEALAGRKPFVTDRADAWAALASGARPEPLETLRPGVDGGLAAAIERAMAKSPADRFWSAAEMAAVIQGGTRPGPEPTLAGAVPGDWGDPATAATAPGPTVAAIGAPADTRVLSDAGSGLPATDVLAVTGRPGPRSGLLTHLRSRRRSLPVMAAGLVALVAVVVLAVTLSRPPATGSAPPAATPPTTSVGSGLPANFGKALQNLERQVSRSR